MSRLNQPYHTDWIRRWAHYSPGKIAIREYESGRALTYLQLHHLACQLAEKLSQDYDLKYGDRIAILAENCIDYFILFTAAQKFGFISRSA